MDWGNIIILVIAGIAGLIAGWVIGIIFKAALFFAGKGVQRLVSIVALVIGVGAAVWYLPEYIEPHASPIIAEMLPPPSATGSAPVFAEKKPVDNAAVAAAIEVALQDLQDPFFEAVLEREPSRAEAVKGRMIGAYNRGGQGALLSELQKAAQDAIKTSFPYYMARGQEQDLLTAVGFIKQVIEVMSVNDPQTCHLWLYGSVAGQSFDFDKYIMAIGQDRHIQLQSHLAAVVRDASEILPQYDEQLAEQRLAEISDRLLEQMGVEKVGLITSGQMPEGEADAQLACDATAGFFQQILEDDLAVDLLRHRYLTSGG
ncbi:hypothetical protein [Parvularcula sp. IMCC14364]|uniref:hypothetical protein n=1 Tax=Parvularcula sp. IMCC14364 TaxID=3067902 RepID=UPI002741523A|nr:hypothetical protein [Parvularcula sp. IMCC14364]